MANSKFLFLSIFVLILLNNVLCEDPVYGIPILHKGPRATNTCSGNNLFQCTAGCDSLMVCDGSGSEPLLTQKCQASTPYCESSATTAICQANPGTNCKTSSTYVCTGAGYFPGNNFFFISFKHDIKVFDFTLQMSAIVQNITYALVPIISL